MLEPSLTSQLLGAGLIAVSFFVAGFVTCYLDVKKKEKEQRKQAKINELLEIQKGYEQEIKSSVWDDLAEYRKYSVSDNDFKTC
ncbi:hypothetical protein [Streptococcus sp. AM43-2AT]|uniref:hypothetical protein n=1 Tax=Streptococcus sp. AM43-2AT TaxID=2293247 RepID=UPI000EDAF0C4|nr:hypothetical protein [Streptococcus sp. AM43-2AT]RJU23443.1 hypothetical protein DW930_09170 [Streptococcus sp. AM43-2AT]